MTIEFDFKNKEKYKDISDKVKSKLTYQDGKISEEESHSCYYENLPEGITKEVVDKISKYNNKFIIGAHIAFAEMASDVFLNKDKNIETINAEVGYFGPHDSLKVTIDKSKKYNNFLATDGETEITKHLVMKAEVTSTSSKPYGLKSVREALSQEFEKLLKGS